MTTRLAGKATRFLPFNRGHQQGPGQPPEPAGPPHRLPVGGVWANDAWLDLLARFVHVEQAREGLDAAKRTDGDLPPLPPVGRGPQAGGRRSRATARAISTSSSTRPDRASPTRSPGSPIGSRRSTTPDDKKVFDKVVVITDRVVLDRQLQDTIYQFEHAHGVVERIDQDSAQLAAALAGEQARIIITTLQKFPFMLEQGQRLPNRRYAVIVDEAHSSQTGEAAKDLKLVLGGRRHRRGGAHRRRGRGCGRCS